MKFLVAFLLQLVFVDISYTACIASNKPAKAFETNSVKEVKSVTDVFQLRKVSFNKTNNTIKVVSKGYPAKDIVYYWDDNSQLEANDVTVVRVNNIEKGRWRLKALEETPFDLWSPAANGVTDDYDKLLAAMKYARDNNTTLVLNSEKTYYIGKPIDYSFTGRLKIKSSDPAKKAKIRLTDKTLLPFMISGSQKLGNRRVTAAITKGQKSITVDNVADFAVGDYIGISSSVDWPLATQSEVQKAEWNIVESIAGNVLLLRHPLQDNYQVKENIAVSRWKYASLQIENIEFICNDTGNKAVVGLSLRFLQDSKVSNCIIRNFQTTGAEARACYNFEFANNQVYGCNEVGMGYGVYPLGGFKYSIHDNKFYGGRKGVDVGGAMYLGPARNVKIYSNMTEGGGLTSAGTDWFDLDVVGGQNMGYAVHEGAENVEFSNNTSRNTCYGYQLRGRDIVVQNNTVSGECIFPFTTLWGNTHSYINNRYTSLLGDKGLVAHPSIDYSKYPRSVFFSDAASAGQIIFKGNSSDFVRDFAIVLDGSRVLAEMVVTNNQFQYTLIDGTSQPNILYWSHLKKAVPKLIVKDNVATVMTKGTVSSTMRLIRDASYPRGKLLDWNTCEVQGLIANDVLILTSDNNKVLTNFNVSKLTITKIGKSTTVKGKINFKLDVNGKLIVLETPLFNTSQNNLFKFTCDTEKASYVGRIDTRPSIQFGKNTNSFTGSYLKDTEYQLDVDIQYNTQ